MFKASYKSEGRRERVTMWQRELSLREWNQGKIERELIQRSCKWIFQPPTASSMSGVWETIVWSAKTVLKSILGAQTVTDVVLWTLLTEVERILHEPSQRTRTIRTISNRYHRPSYWCGGRSSVCLLGSLRKLTFTERSGGRFNFWSICFGKGAWRSTSQPSNNEVNGEDCCLISNPTPWFCLLTTSPPEGIGISAECWRRTRVQMDCEGQDQGRCLCSSYTEVVLAWERFERSRYDVDAEFNCWNVGMFRTNLFLISDVKIIRKLLGFFDRDLSAGHVTSFSMWLARWSVRVAALFYGRERTELVSKWFVLQFYLALYLHVLYFYFSFQRSSWKILFLSPTVVTDSICR